MKQEIAHQNHMEMLAGSEAEQERQAYFEELKLESQQFGAGRNGTHGAAEVER